MEVLQTMVEGQAMHSKDIEKALGRCMSAGEVDAPATLGLEDGHYHGGETPPRWSRCWRAAVPFVQYSPYLPKSSWWGCSDASASDEGLAFVGGWCANKVEPKKKEVYWFHEQIHVEEYPWAFKNGDPKRRIAAFGKAGHALPL